MKVQLTSAIVLTAMALVAPLAQAGMLDNLKDNAGNAVKQQSGNAMSSDSGAGSLMSQLSSGSMHLASPQNVAGVLGYCQKQGYAPSAADTVKSKLMKKVGGQSEAEQSDSYKQGLGGLLQGDNGQSFNLSSLKSTIGKKVCGRIADKAVSSFLGG